MRSDGRLILGLALLIAALVVSACSGVGQASSGVAQIDDPQVVKPPVKSAGPSNPQSETPAQLASETGASIKKTDTANPTDEELTTNFTVCLRDHELNIPDPVLNADGSVDLGALKQSFDQYSNGKRSSQALDECLHLLDGATFSKKDSPEDEIQLQDDLLAFTQCLRDEGIDVPDPDFSGDPRAGMGAMKQALKGANARMERGIDSCNELVFGAGKSGK